MLPHGAQKVLGWFGGHGFSGTMHHFNENMGIPCLFALLAVLAESFGALGLSQSDEKEFQPLAERIRLYK